jgi:hypothetical protein
MELAVQVVHRVDCTFGSGFYRVQLADGGVRYCRDLREVRQVQSLLPGDAIQYVERDGYCLDGDRQGDANTPDVVDGETWLAMPRADAMESVGLTSEADYQRVYRQVEAAVYRRDNRASQGGVRASIVLKKRGARVLDV